MMTSNKYKLLKQRNLMSTCSTTLFWSPVPPMRVNRSREPARVSCRPGGADLRAGQRRRHPVGDESGRPVEARSFRAAGKDLGRLGGVFGPLCSGLVPLRWVTFPNVVNGKLEIWQRLCGMLVRPLKLWKDIKKGNNTKCSGYAAHVVLQQTGSRTFPGLQLRETPTEAAATR